jgi:hypothetical protein
MKVSAFKVSIGYTDGTSIDITDSVLYVNIEENLFGFLAGNLSIVDGLGILDSAITNRNNIIIEFEYLKSKVKQSFYLDGVNSIDSTTSLTKKTYVINIKAIDTILNSMKLVSKSFKGRSTDIIKTIFDESFNTKLKVLTDSLTQGHYIAPNVSPSTAIAQVQNRAYDLNQNPFFLFQRLVDNKSTFLTSLGQINDQMTSAVISTQIQNSETVDKVLKNIGQPASIIIHSDNDKQAQKIAGGVYGKNIVNLDVSNSTVTNEAYGASTNSTSKLNLVRPDMFDNDSKPLLHNGDYSNLCKMQTILNLLFNTKVTAYGCQAIPAIGVGNKVELQIHQNRQGQGPSDKFSGNYIVSKIVHRIEDNEYTQTIDLARG